MLYSPPRGQMSGAQVAVEDVNKALAVSHLGLMFILTVGGMIFLGMKVDAWAGTSPWGVLVGLALGFATGFYYLVATVFKQGDDDGQAGGGDAEGLDEDTNGGA